MVYCEGFAAHWPAGEQATAYGVCQAESGDNPGAIGDNGQSRGLGQIYGPAHPEFAGWNLFDPEQNAQASLQIWQASGWGAWSTYNNGAYRRYAGNFNPSVGGGGGTFVTPIGTFPAAPLLIAAVATAVYLLTR